MFAGASSHASRGNDARNTFGPVDRPVSTASIAAATSAIRAERDESNGKAPVKARLEHTAANTK